MTQRMMRIADVLRLPSVDSWAASHKGNGGYSAWSIVDTLAGKEVDGWPYDDIRTEIINDGINRIPLHVDLGWRMAAVYTVDVPEGMEDGLMFGNGHHRLKIMIEENLEWVLVSDDQTETTDDPSEIGSGQYAVGDDATLCECATGCNCWRN